MSVQAQILNLLADLKAPFGLTMVFIAHDLAVVKNVSDRVAVMYLGQAGRGGRLRTSSTERPAHPYTEALLASIPDPDPDAAATATGADRRAPLAPRPAVGLPVPDPVPLRPGRCAPTQEPPLREIAPGHQVACHFPLVNGERHRTRRWPPARSVQASAAATPRPADRAPSEFDA